MNSSNATADSTITLPTSPLHVVLHAPPPRRRWLSAIGWIGFLLCGIALMNYQTAKHDYFDTTSGIREHFHSGSENSSDKVAIIAVRGVIMDGNGYVKQQIDRVREDKRVKAIVLRVNSPGGTVTGSDYIYHHLNRLRAERDLPLVVSMGSMATSGGYYVSMAVGEQEGAIFAEPTTMTGSIGVIIPHYDLSGLLDKFNVQDNSIASHPRKQLLSMTRPMSAEDQSIVQQYVDSLFERFKNIVKAGRPALRDADQTDTLLAPNTQRDLATGELFPAPQALEFGLIDEIGFIEDAIKRASELADLNPEKIRVVEYHRPVSLLNMVGLAQSKSQSTDWNQLLELAVPQAYYLATSLPPFAATEPYASK